MDASVSSQDDSTLDRE
jgi:hypothetical protein